MKLLVITQKYDINDSNLGVFIDWWDKLAEKTEKIYILALEKHSKPTKANMEVISMGKEKGIGFFGKIFGFYAGFFKTIGKADAIFVHMIPKYVILAAPVALIYKKPIYLWYTGVSAHWQLRFAILFCKKVFTAHEAAMRINTSKRIITGHGIDAEKFKYQMSPGRTPTAGQAKVKSSDAITILSIGRITPSKGHDLIIRAVADLIKSDYDLKLKIIGGIIQKYHRKYFEFLKKLVKDLKIDKKTKFSGSVSYDKMPEYFQNAEILINAVPFGGLDKVVLEAMASGVIPLTSNSAFLTVFPKSIAQGLVFKNGDIGDLKIKLGYILDKKLYQNETFRRELRSIVVENHNLDSLISKILVEIAKN